MDHFHFFFKRSFRYENDDEKTKNETIVFKKLVVSLTIINDKPSLTIVNDRFQERLTTLHTYYF